MCRESDVKIILYVKKNWYGKEEVKIQSGTKKIGDQGPITKL